MDLFIKRQVSGLKVIKTFLNNKNLDIEYHHAFTQTGPTEEQIDKLTLDKFSRDTQTAVLKISSTHTKVDQSTQNFGDANDALFLLKNADTQLEPHEKYESFEEMERRKDFIGKVRMIQRNFRTHRLKVCVREKAAEFRQIQARKKKREDRIKQDYINMNRKSGEFPKTKKDFDSLLAQISTWKESEVCHNFN